MPRTGGQQTREWIVRRAAELFRQESFHAVGIQDILKVCGISKGTFYFYFVSKLELGEAVIDLYTEAIPAEEARCFDGRAWHDGLKTFLNPAARSRKVSPFSLCLTKLGLEFAHRHEMLVAKIAAIMRVEEAILTGSLVASGLDDRAATRRAATCAAAIRGYLMRRAVSGDIRFVEEAIRHLAELGQPHSPARKSKPARRARKPSGGDEKHFAENVKIDLDSIDDRSIIKWHSVSGQPQTGVSRKRMDIVRRAAVCFWDRGYAATPLDEILDECLVPKGSFHYYFPSKRALASTVLDFYRLRTEEIMEKALGAGGWEDTVDVLCEIVGKTASGAPGLGCPLGNMGLEFANTDGGLGLQVAETLQSMENMLGGGLKRAGVDDAKVAGKASYAVALLQGHITRFIIHGDAGVVAQLREDLLELAR